MGEIHLRPKGDGVLSQPCDSHELHGFLYLIAGEARDGREKCGKTNVPTERIRRHTWAEHHYDLWVCSDGAVVHRIEAWVNRQLRKVAKEVGLHGGHEGCRFDGDTETWRQNDLHVYSLDELIEWLQVNTIDDPNMPYPKGDVVRVTKLSAEARDAYISGALAPKQRE